MTYELILTRTEGDKVGVITLNRPKQLNALNDQLMTELGQALQAFDADPAIACMVITGSEKAFAKKIKSSITRFFWEKKIQFEIRTTKQQIKEELTEIRKEILGMNKGDATVKDIAADAIQILMLKVA